MTIRTGQPSDKMVLQELLKGLIGKPGQTLTNLIKEGEKAGVNFLFNVAATGRVSGITYFHWNLKIKGQALGKPDIPAGLIKLFRAL